MIYKSSFFLSEAEKIKSQIITWRRQLHRYPELSFNEKKTAAMITGVLKKLGLEVRTGIGGTGVVGILRGMKDNKSAVALRADMDALPLHEDTGVDYASRNSGRMHACGHDAHMSMVLGTAAMLANYRQNLPGSVVFIFQPGEEKPPGGARLMIEEGVLENPPVKAIFGLHVTSSLPTGTVGIRDGAVMASADNFTIKIKGRSSHGASPHLGSDAIVASAQVILMLQSIVARRLDPVEPCVLTIGTVNGGEKENIVASEVTMTGTVRAINPSLRQQLETEMRQVLEGAAKATDTIIKLDYLHGYPALWNDSNLFKKFHSIATRMLGAEGVKELDVPSMGAEDFARYAEKVPALYFNLGAAIPGEEFRPWHHPRFNINEDCLPIGVALLSAAVMDTLNNF